MTTFRLPEILGAGEVEATEMWGGCAGGRPEYQIGGITVVMPPGMPMEQVRPPLPEEPPVGSVVLIHGEALQRFEENDESDRPMQCWAGVGSAQRYTWVQLCDLALPGVPERLVLDGGVVVEEPVALPWMAISVYGVSVTVDRQGSPALCLRVLAGSESFHLRPEMARQMGRALVATAEAAERDADLVKLAATPERAS